MALQYRYTSGIHANTGGTPWDTARAGVFNDAQPTTRVAMYDAFATFLLGVGFTRYNRQLAGASPSQATRDDVWTSLGEANDRFIVIRTALHATSGAAGTQFLSVIIAPKRNDAAQALSGTWTWNGTTTVASTNTSQVAIGSWIKLNANAQWFKITTVVANTSVTIVSGGFVIPTGATGSSVLAPNVVAEVGNSNLDNAGGFNNDIYRFDLTGSDFTADYQMVGDLNCVHWVLQNSSHATAMYVVHVGGYTTLDSNANSMYLSTAVTAGDFKDLITVNNTGASVNPISLGYRPMDRIRIVNVNPNGTAQAETQVIVRVQTDRITVRRLRFAYDGMNLAVNPQVIGARIGQSPVNVFMNMSADNEIELDGSPGQQSNHFRTPFYQDPLVDAVDPIFPGRTSGDLVSGPTLRLGENSYFQHYAQLTTYAQTNTEYGTGTTPNNRTLRFTLRSVAMGFYQSTTGNPGGSFVGKIPRLGAYTGSVSYYPHDNMKRDRVTPNQDFVPFRYTSASARNYVLGPTPGP